MGCTSGVLIKSTVISWQEVTKDLSRCESEQGITDEQLNEAALELLKLKQNYIRVVGSQKFGVKVLSDI